MKNKLEIIPREGKPNSCIVCGGKLHNKSEYYCSKTCAGKYVPENTNYVPEFLSKWKIRKRKEMRDPTIKLRQKTRKTTNRLVKEGKINKKPCNVCGDKIVIPHHEDYNNPNYVIWLCEKHHKDYHSGKIKINGGKLEWDENRVYVIRDKKVRKPHSTSMLNSGRI